MVTKYLTQKSYKIRLNVKSRNSSEDTIKRVKTDKSQSGKKIIYKTNRSLISKIYKEFL